MSGSEPSKKPSVYSFQTEWEENYCFIEIKVNNSDVCLLCNASVTY